MQDGTLDRADLARQLYRSITSLLSHSKGLLPHHEIAILFRDRFTRDEVADRLNKLGLPCQCADKHLVTYQPIKLVRDYAELAACLADAVAVPKIEKVCNNPKRKCGESLRTGMCGEIMAVRPRQRCFEAGHAHAGSHKCMHAEQIRPLVFCILSTAACPGVLRVHALCATKRPSAGGRGSTHIFQMPQSQSHALAPGICTPAR